MTATAEPTITGRADILAHLVATQESQYQAAASSAADHSSYAVGGVTCDCPVEADQSPDQACPDCQQLADLDPDQHLQLAATHAQLAHAHAIAMQANTALLLAELARLRGQQG